MNLQTMRAGCPAWAAAATRSISVTIVDCSVNGATRSCFVGRSVFRLARCRNTASASAVISGSVVRKPTSV